MMSIQAVEDWAEFRGLFSSNAALGLRPNDTLMATALTDYLVTRRYKLVTNGLSSIQEVSNATGLQRMTLEVILPQKHYELLTYPGRRSFKQRARKQTVELKPDKLYTPSEVAALLNVSYDTAVRRMQSMKGCVDMGTQTKRYKRGKKLLRISGKNLIAFLRAKTRD